MSVAAATREAIKAHPFLLDAMRLDVLNFTAAARFLDVGETEAVAAALRRLSTDLSPAHSTSVDLRVRMERGIGEVHKEEALLQIGEAGFGKVNGPFAGIIANGTSDARTVGTVLLRVAEADIELIASAATPTQFILIVPSTAAATSIRCVEETMIIREDPTDSNETR